MDVDPDFARALNVALTAALVVVLAITLAVTSRTRSAYARADALSVGIRLPYGTDAMRDAIARRMRRVSVSVAVVALSAIAVSAPLLATPLGSHQFYVFIVILPVALSATAVGGVAASVRERLFSPAPDVPRVARARRMRLADYFDPLRLRLPWALAALAALALAWLAVVWVQAPERVDATPAAASVVLGLLTAGILIAYARVVRFVLDQPQPASDTLELAWDDALRTITLAGLATVAASLPWFALAFSVIALTDALPWSAFAPQLPTWGMIAIQFVYHGWGRGRRLRPALYPHSLREPVAAGSAS